MPLRDDHDAALARADALATGLERERASQAEQAGRLAMLQAELVAARTRLTRAEDELGKLKPPVVRASTPVPKSSSATPPHADPPVVRVAIVVALLGIGVAGVVRGQPGPDIEESDSRPAAPVPPFVADQLVDDGIARLPQMLRLRQIAIAFVREDGTLDPMHGRITIETTQLGRHGHPMTRLGGPVPRSETTTPWRC